MENEKMLGLFTRFSDVQEEMLEPLPPIIILLHSSPLTSIKNAVSTLPIANIGNSLATLQNYAKLRSNPYSLTQDEIVALFLYTSAWLKFQESLYFKVNTVLRENDRTKVLPYLSYIVVLLSAISKIPPYKKTVYRGVKKSMREEYKSKRNQQITVIWNSFSSCTEKIEVLESDLFLGYTGARTLFIINSLRSFKIAEYSFFKEDEVIFVPMSCFTVEGILEQGDLTIITLQEIKPIEDVLSIFESCTTQMDSPSSSTVVTLPSTPETKVVIPVLTDEVQTILVKCQKNPAYLEYSGSSYPKVLMENGFGEKAREIYKSYHKGYDLNSLVEWFSKPTDEQNPLYGYSDGVFDTLWPGVLKQNRERIRKAVLLGIQIVINNDYNLFYFTCSLVDNNILTTEEIDEYTDIIYAVHPNGNNTSQYINVIEKRDPEKAAQAILSKCKIDPRYLEYSRDKYPQILVSCGYASEARAFYKAYHAGYDINSLLDWFSNPKNERNPLTGYSLSVFKALWPNVLERNRDRLQQAVLIGSAKVQGNNWHNFSNNLDQIGVQAHK